MSQSPSIPSAAPAGTDTPTRLEAFLDQHARKVVLLLVLVLALVAAFVARNLMAKEREAEAGRALVAAATNEDLRAVSSGFPGTPAATSAMILLADNLAKSGDLDEAAATLNGALALAPAEPLLSQARLALGLILVRQGEHDKAIGEFEKVLKSGDATGLAPLALIYHGELLESKGDLDEARARFQQVSTDFPESTFALFASGVVDRVGFVPPVEIDPPPAVEPAPTIKDLLGPIDTQLPPTPATPGLSISLDDEEEGSAPDAAEESSE